MVVNNNKVAKCTVKKCILNIPDLLVHTYELTIRDVLFKYACYKNINSQNCLKLPSHEK